MLTDYQSNTDFLVFTQQVNRIDPDFLPDFLCIRGDPGNPWLNWSVVLLNI
jgi:hypothetical protein